MGNNKARKKRKKKKTPKKSRKLTAAEKAEKRRRRREYKTIFVNGKKKRVKREPTIDGLPVDEFIAQNADPIWLMQNGMYEALHPWHLENEIDDSFRFAGDEDDDKPAQEHYPDENDLPF